jgi:Beta-propeller repeat
MSQPLTIDPLLTYSTFLGGNGTDEGNAIAVDSSGAVYVAGGSYSTNFPTANPVQGSRAGSQDMFVSKLSADGHTLLYSTYLGGTGADTALALALDGSGNIALVGASASSDFPTLNALDSSYGGSCSGSPCNNAIVAELNASGSALRYSTYLGAAGEDQARGVAVDASGKIYATGVITGGLSTLNGYATAPGGGMDAFLVKLDPQQSGSASLLYGSYLGGSSDDEGYGLALDSAGLAYIVGRTASSGFPTKNAAQSSRGGGSDAFLSVIDPASNGSASLRYSTYLVWAEVATTVRQPWRWPARAAWR